MYGVQNIIFSGELIKYLLVKFSAEFTLFWKNNVRKLSQ